MVCIIFNRNNQCGQCSEPSSYPLKLSHLITDHSRSFGHVSENAFYQIVKISSIDLWYILLVGMLTCVSASISKYLQTIVDMEQSNNNS